MKDPIQFMIENGQTIVDAFQIGKTPKETWKILQGTLPQIQNEMTSKTWEIYGPVFVQVSEHLQRLKLETGKLWTTPNIDGWGLYLGKDNYYRAHRTINGRPYSVHIGRALDEAKARRKIAQKERELGLRGEMIDAESESKIDPYFKIKIEYIEASPPTRQQVRDVFRDLLPIFKNKPRKSKNTPDKKATSKT